MQVKNIVSKKAFFISAVLIILMCMGNFVFNISKYNGMVDQLVPHPSALTLLSTGSEYVNLVVRLFPFIVIVPASFTYLRDYNSRAVNLIQARSGSKLYFITLALAIFVMTFLIFIIPLTLELLISLIAFPAYSSTISEYDIYYSAGWLDTVQRLPYKSLLDFSRTLYGFLYIFNFSLAASVFAVSVAALSTYKIKFSVLLFLPVYLFLFFLGLIGNRFGLIAHYHNYIFAYDYTIPDGKRHTLFFYMVLVIVLVLSLLRFKQCQKKDTLV